MPREIAQKFLSLAYFILYFPKHICFKILPLSRFGSAGAHICQTKKTIKSCYFNTDHCTELNSIDIEYHHFSSTNNTQY